MHEDMILGGRYRLEDELGSGGMAVVWRAQDEVLGRSVAVKVLNGGSATDPASLSRIRREARTAAALSHPNIAQVHDFGVADIDGQPAPYVVMELVLGETVEQRLTAGPLTPQEAFRVCAEVAAALHAAHTAGLVHRDIKPANVIMTPTGAKVVDFGIAASIDPDASGELSDDLLGTPSYIAPERITDNAVEPASDVYALGVLLYKLLTGHLPWTTDGPAQMLTAHVYTPPAALPALPGVPDQVIDLCHRCLRKDPAERPTAVEATTVLAAAGAFNAADDRPTSGPPGPPSPPAGHRATPDPTGSTAGTLTRHRHPLVIAAISAGVAIAVAALLATVLAGRPAKHDAVTAQPAATGEPPSGAPAPGDGTVPPAGSPRVTTASTSTPPLIGPPPSTATSTDAPSPNPNGATPGTTPSAPTSDIPAPQPRTLSSAGGTVRAICTSTDLAELLSTTPATSYRIEHVEAGPAPEATAVFRHGNKLVRMTVTCTNGIPAAVIGS